MATQTYWKWYLKTIQQKEQPKKFNLFDTSTTSKPNIYSNILAKVNEPVTTTFKPPIQQTYWQGSTTPTQINKPLLQKAKTQVETPLKAQDFKQPTKTSWIKPEEDRTWKMSLQEFWEMIKWKYPDYANIDSTELWQKMLEKYPDYKASVYTTTPINDMSLLWETGQRAVNLKEKMLQRWQNIVDIAKRWEWIPLSPLQKVWRNIWIVWQFAWWVWDVFAEWIAYITPDIVKNALTWAWKSTWNSLDEKTKKDTVSAIKQGWEVYKEFKQNNPYLAYTIEWSLNIASLPPIAKGTQLVWQWVKWWTKQVLKWWKILKEQSKKLIPNTETVADRLSTNINRMTKWEINKFKEEIWVSPWKFLNDRWLTDSWDDLVEKLSKNLKQSRQEADKGLESIQWTFKTPKEKIATDIVDKKTWKYLVKEQDPIETMLTDNLTNASSKWMAKDSLRAKELLERYKEWWLEMSEINEAKRWFNANNKFGYFTDDTTARKWFVTNLDNTIRKWQYDTAEKMWFSNLKEVNKQTKAYYKLLEWITKWNEWTQGNLPMWLTDWLAFNADPWIFLAKQVAQSWMLKKWTLKLLNLWRKTQQEVQPALISNQTKNVSNIRNSSNSPIVESTKLKNVKPKIITPKKPNTLNKKIEQRKWDTTPKQPAPLKFKELEPKKLNNKPLIKDWKIESKINPQIQNRLDKSKIDLKKENTSISETNLKNEIKEIENFRKIPDLAEMKLWEWIYLVKKWDYIYPKDSKSLEVLKKEWYIGFNSDWSIRDWFAFTSYQDFKPTYKPNKINNKWFIELNPKLPTKLKPKENKLAEVIWKNIEKQVKYYEDKKQLLSFIKKNKNFDDWDSLYDEFSRLYPDKTVSNIDEIKTILENDLKLLKSK